MSQVSKATGDRVNNVDSLVKYAASGKGALAVTASAAVQAGVDPATFFEGVVLDPQRNAELANLRDGLVGEFNRIYGAVNKKETVFLSPMEQQTADDLLAKAVCAYMVRAGFTDLQKAHTMLRLFLAMDDQLVKRAVTLGWAR